MRRYRLGAQTNTDLKIHIIWSPKYRKKVLSGQVAIRTRDILRQIALEHELDVVLMDVQMQEMEGLEGTSIIRSLEKPKNIPQNLPGDLVTRLLDRLAGKKNLIIAITAHAMGEDQDRCVKAGTDTYLTKPFQGERNGV